MATVLKRSRLAVWKDVIFAIFIREIRSKFSDKLGISWAVIEPVVFIFLLSSIRGLVSGGHTHTVPTFVFMFYGMTLVQLFLTTVSASSGAILRNRSLFAFRQVQPISAVIAASLFELLVKAAVFLGIYGLMYLIGIEVRLDNPLLLITVVCTVWLFATAFGMIFGLLRCFVIEVSKVENLIMKPVFFISGVFFSLQDINSIYWPYLNWNPVLNGIELARDAAYTTFGAKGVSLDYLLFVTLTAVCLSLCCYRVLWKRAISR
ncbi:ABC transporter permease [Agarivorans sp. TSD2052]|uniref:ABC transporter permease n=1 Tax=Agarivorans sp. TSD2052 TaxID=2937286 RepID=UPI00200C28CB|nr:ABC transporter permease [Agarivorans sp. TSD2052]UPW20049.1 ABC transporter permease [Agarivorans sp. TSD2052]